MSTPRMPDVVRKYLEDTSPTELSERLRNGKMPAAAVFKKWNNQLQEMAQKAIFTYLCKVVRTPECYEHFNNETPYQISMMDLADVYNFLKVNLFSEAKAQEFFKTAMENARELLNKYQKYDVVEVDEEGRHVKLEDKKFALIPLEVNLDEVEEPSDYTNFFAVRPAYFELEDEDTQEMDEVTAVSSEDNVNPEATDSSNEAEPDEGSDELTQITPNIAVHIGSNKHAEEKYPEEDDFDKRVQEFVDSHPVLHERHTGHGGPLLPYDAPSVPTEEITSMADSVSNEVEVEAEEPEAEADEVEPDAYLLDEVEEADEEVYAAFDAESSDDEAPKDDENSSNDENSNNEEDSCNEEDSSDEAESEQVEEADEPTIEIPTPEVAEEDTEKVEKIKALHDLLNKKLEKHS